MALFPEILSAVLPIVLVGGIGVFVILRLKHKQSKGTLGKKKSRDVQIWLDSLIPFGMLIGFAIAVLLSIISSVSLVSTMTWGPGIGMLVGYLSYEFYSKKEERHSE